MTKLATICSTVLLLLPACSTAPPLNLADINPVRVYRGSFDDLRDAIKMYSRKEDFRLDRSGEEVGRIIGHRNTSSSAREGREPSVATTAMMIIMNIKLRRISDLETEMTAKFSFETGHVFVTKEEEGMLVDCYSTLFSFLDGQFERAGVVTPS